MPQPIKRRAFLAITVRGRRWWVFVASVLLVFSLLMWFSIDERYGWTMRVLWSPVYAMVPTLGVVGVSLGVAHLLNLRRFRRRLSAGVVLEARIDDHALVLRGPWSATTLSFDGIASVRSRRGWVALQQVGLPLVSMWPEALFLPTDLARLERSIEMREH